MQNFFVQLNLEFVILFTEPMLEFSAKTFYEKVVEYGDTAFCSATPTDDCFPEVPENASWTGQWSSETGGSDNFFSLVTC